MNTFGSTFCGWEQIVAQFNGLTEKLKPNQALLWCSFKIIWISPSELQLSAWKWLVMHLVHFKKEGMYVCDGALVYTLLYWLRPFFINRLFPFHLPCDKYCNPSHCATATTQSEFLVIFLFFFELQNDCNFHNRAHLQLHSVYASQLCHMFRLPLMYGGRGCKNYPVMCVTAAGLLAMPLPAPASAGDELRCHLSHPPASERRSQLLTALTGLQLQSLSSPDDVSSFLSSEFFRSLSRSARSVHSSMSLWVV